MAHLGFKRSVEFLSTHNFLCQKFAAISLKIVIPNSLPPDHLSKPSMLIHSPTDLLTVDCEFATKDSNYIF